ncbi:MAG: DUF2723 domain-containing protein, partial [Myxococcales bacterium]|nr:DUF2723 domain-containing protein [Myxococcales bacterium]
MSPTSLTRTRIAGAAPFGIATAAFVLYLATLCPTIYWKDSSEFVTVVHGLDVAHPAGSPTYSLLAKLFDLLPFADIATRVNLASAAAAAAAVGLLYALALEFLSAVGVAPSRRGWIGVAAVGLFALSPAWWLLASTAEVYPLQNVFLIGVLGLLTRWWRTRGEGEGDLRLLAGAALLYGVSAGAHAAIAFFLPGIVLFGAVTLRSRMLRPRLMAALAAAFALGLSVYLYLPVRSLAGDLAYDWGNPETPARFLDHVLDRKDAALLTSVSAPKLPYQARLFAGFARDQITVVGAVLAVVG